MSLKNMKRKRNERTAKKRPHIYGALPSDEGLYDEDTSEFSMKNKYMENRGKGGVRTMRNTPKKATRESGGMTRSRTVLCAIKACMKRFRLGRGRV